MSRAWLYGLTATLCILILGAAVLLNLRSGPTGPDNRIVYGEDQVDFCKEVQADLAAERFDALDRQGRNLATLKDRFVGGSDKLTGFYDFTGKDGCTTPFCEARPVQADHIKTLQHWLNRDPHNPVAKTAMALNWYYAAWMARGCANFADVTFDQWQGFFDRLRIARSYLDTVNPHDNPAYYALMLDMLRESGGPRERIDALYEEGRAAHPDFYQLIARYTRALDPGWFGRKGDVAWLAETQLNDPGGDSGQVSYSFVASQAALQVSTDRFFSETGMSWDKVKASFAVRKRLYGLNVHDWNVYCYIAYAAGDRDTAREAYEHFGENWDESVWDDQSFWFNSVLPWIKRQ